MPEEGLGEEELGGRCSALDADVRARMQELLASAAKRRRDTALRDGRNPWY